MFTQSVVGSRQSAVGSRQSAVVIRFGAVIMHLWGWTWWVGGIGQGGPARFALFHVEHVVDYC